LINFFILVLGTIGMKKQNGSYSPCPFYLEDLVNKNPLFNSKHLPAFTFYSFPKLLDSSDMLPKNWLLIANVVKNNYDKYDRFIILYVLIFLFSFVIIHGTDTLTYSSSALSFLLGNLKKIVVVCL
jgi:L-asparaginase